MGHVQVTLVDDTVKPHETNNSGRSKVRNNETSQCCGESPSSESLSGPNSSCRTSSCSAETSPRVRGRSLSLCLDYLQSFESLVRSQWLSDCQQRGSQIVSGGLTAQFVEPAQNHQMDRHVDSTLATTSPRTQRWFADRSYFLQRKMAWCNFLSFQDPSFVPLASKVSVSFTG